MSLEKLGLDYLDMYLIHLPFAFKFDDKTGGAATHEDGSYVLDFDTDPVSVWKVGVSKMNYLRYYYIIKKSLKDRDYIAGNGKAS